MFVFLIVALLALSYILSRSTDVLVSGIRQLAKGTALEEYGLVAVLVALATSLPELFVGVAAALRGASSLPLGVVVGSNIANLSLVIGGAALVAGSVKASDRVYRKDILQAFLIGSLPLLLLFDKTLSRMDGLVLLLVYGFFVLVTVTGKRKKELQKVEREYYDGDLGHRVLAVLGRKDVEQGLGRFAVGSVGLLLSAEMIVRLSGEIAVVIGIPVILVGLFMVSVGTSLPEITFEISTIRRREYLMAFGNIVGSTVANSSLILGVVALLAPIRLGDDASVYFVSVLGFVIIFLLFWLFSYTKRRLDRWEGLVLVLAYFGFILAQINFFG